MSSRRNDQTVGELSSRRSVHHSKIRIIIVNYVYVLGSIFTLRLKSCCVCYHPWYTFRSYHWLWIWRNSCAAGKHISHYLCKAVKLWDWFSLSSSHCMFMYICLFVAFLKNVGDRFLWNLDRIYRNYWFGFADGHSKLESCILLILFLFSWLELKLLKIWKQNWYQFVLLCSLIWKLWWLSDKFGGHRKSNCFWILWHSWVNCAKMYSV